MNEAIKVLQTRIANLKNMEVSENIAKEIKDLEALVDEIHEKIKDHNDMEKKPTAFLGKCFVLYGIWLILIVVVLSFYFR